MPVDSEPAQSPPSHGIAAPVGSRLACHGCGHLVPLEERRPFRCPAGSLDNATGTGDGVDHVLRRRFDAAVFSSWSDAGTVFDAPEPNPFRKYRRLFYSYEIAKLGGLSDSSYLRIVDRLDAAIHAVSGRGFATTPFTPADDLYRAAGVDAGRLWIKDETGNVSGSHKARHLMGILLWLEVMRSVHPSEPSDARLAISSCGNAALAAGELARAAGQSLEVFVPPDARPEILGRLAGVGAEITTCDRSDDDPAGDPCYLRFLESLGRDALPFTVQANQNGLTIEGGSTLAWEMVSRLRASGASLDHLVLQVGGGALATSCIQGLRDAEALGVLERMPRVHTVQTRSAFPLRRAYARIADRLLGGADPTTAEGGAWTFDVAADDRRALELRDAVEPTAVARALKHAAGHRSDFMWPWESPPKSIAYGILDDETYDWLAVVEGMLDTAGIALAVSESRLAEAHSLAHEHTAIDVEATGSAGLAGLLELIEAGVVKPGESAAVLFTGVER